MPAYYIEVVDPNGETTSHSSNTPGSTSGVTTNWSNATVAGNDIRGTLSATTGSTAPGAGNVFTVTFSSPYASAPVVLVNGPLGPYATSVSNAGFTLTVGSAPAASTAYSWFYEIIG